MLFAFIMTRTHTLSQNSRRFLVFTVMLAFIAAGCGHSEPDGPGEANRPVEADRTPKGRSQTAESDETNPALQNQFGGRGGFARPEGTQPQDATGGFNLQDVQSRRRAEQQARAAARAARRESEARESAAGESAAGESAARELAARELAAGGDDSWEPASPPKPDSPIPWSTPREAANYVLLDRDLYDVQSGERVAPQFSDGSTNLRLVADAPDHLLSPGPQFGFGGGRPDTQFGFANGAQLFDYSSGRRLMTKWSDLQRQPPLAEATWSHLADDFRRVVFLKQGDVWRAEVNWTAGKAVNPVQVTSVGQLATAKPLLWTGNDLYLWGGFSEERPVVRIDLVEKDLEEIDDRGVFSAEALDPRNPQQGRNFSFRTNPAGRLVFSADYEVVQAFDARVDTTAKVGNVFQADHWLQGKRTHLALPDGTPNTKNHEAEILGWQDETTAVAYIAAVGDSTGQPAALLLLDFARLEIRPLIVFDRDTLFEDWSISKRAAAVNKRIELAILSVIDDARHADAVLVDRSNFGEETVISRWQIDLKTGKRTPLPDQLSLNGIWIDGRRYLYSQGGGDGGLQSIGTWVYDVAAGKPRRVLPLPARLRTVQLRDIDDVDVQKTPPENVLLLPEQDLAIFTPEYDQGRGAYLVDLGGSEGRPLSEQSVLRVSSISADAVNLGFGDDADRGPWKTQQPAGKPLFTVRDKNGVLMAGQLRLMTELQDQPQDVRRFARAAYQHVASRIAPISLFDPACVTLKLVEEYQRQGAVSAADESRVMQKLALMDLGDCVDRERAIQYAADQTLMRSAFAGGEAVSDERIRAYCRCVGQKFAEWFTETPNQNVKVLGSLLNKAIRDCGRLPGGR